VVARNRVRTLNTRKRVFLSTLQPENLQIFTNHRFGCCACGHTHRVSINIPLYLANKRIAGAVQKPTSVSFAYNFGLLCTDYRFSVQLQTKHWLEKSTVVTLTVTEKLLHFQQKNNGELLYSYRHFYQNEFMLHVRTLRRHQQHTIKIE